MTTTPIRLCLLGHSGTGKSTTSALIRHAADARGLTSTVVKVAAPLYDLQQAFYARMGRDLDVDQQDQQLMEALAGCLRFRDPDFMIRDFLARVAASNADVVVNDDVRSYQYDLPRLREQGWVTIRIVTDPVVRKERLAARGFLTLSDASTEGVDDLSVDFEISNDSDLRALALQVTAVVDEVLSC
ncbi:hypothetical protein [Nocardia sp. R6R-6]|uniref:hypothetical protein n=1 Tax=Nocardia sp. R6R-6 TaxID=3459303 RepID=UPI00403D8392